MVIQQWIINTCICVLCVGLYWRDKRRIQSHHSDSDVLMKRIVCLTLSVYSVRQFHKSAYSPAWVCNRKIWNAFWSVVCRQYLTFENSPIPNGRACFAFENSAVTINRLQRIERKQVLLRKVPHRDASSIRNTYHLIEMCEYTLHSTINMFEWYKRMNSMGFLTKMHSSVQYFIAMWSIQQCDIDKCMVYACECTEWWTFNHLNFSAFHKIEWNGNQSASNCACTYKMSAFQTAQ